MRSNIREVLVGDIYESISDTYKGDAENVVLINTSDVLTGEVLNHQKVPNKNLKGQFKKTFKKNDILYSEIRPINQRNAFVNFDPENYIASTKLMVLRPKSKDVVPEYMFRFLNSDYVLRYLQSLAETRSGTFPQITFSELASIPIKLPNVDTQHSIIDVLSCLDNKIQLNNKINENLEEQAQAIFKSWFVDFEPFQDGEFVESELGLIPKGWKIEKLGELIDVKYGKDHRALSDGDIPVYGSGGIMRYVDKSLYEKETVLIPRKGSLNNVTLINHPFWSVDTMFYTQMKIENFTKFLYHLLLMKDLASMNVGSAVPSMTVSLLNEIKFALPPMSILAEFENITSAIYNLIWSNQKENLILSNIRDTLLPKLMSGEIEVPIE